jgi:hypothetical protein
MTNNDLTYGGCTTQCQLGPRCGDGVLDVGEQCDLGSQNTAIYGAAAGCAPGCRFPHRCGDGELDDWVGERCDFGAANGMPDVPCTVDCKVLQ